MKKTISVSLILIGATAISAQIILMREFLTVFYGNELSVGFLLFVWLLGGALGSKLAAKLRDTEFEHLAGSMMNLQIAAAVLVPFSIILMRLPRLFFKISFGEIIDIPHMLVWALITLLPICLIMGYMFVLGCGLYRHRDSNKKIISTYVLEAMGAAIGGFVTSLILIKFLNNLYIAFIISCLNIAVVYFLSRGVVRHRILYRFFSLSMLLIILLTALTGGLRLLDKYFLRLKWSGISLLDSRDSIYGNVAIAQLSGQYTFFMNGLHMLSAPDQLTAEEVVHFPMLMHPRPQEVLLLGGGVGDVIDELLKYKDIQVTYVELDPLVIKLADEYLKNEPWYKLGDSRINTVHTDARYFVKNTDKRFDVVIINLPNPYTAQLNRFYTKEFYSELWNITDENSIISFGVGSSENYISSELGQFLRSIYLTVRTVFPEVKVIPGDTAYFLAAKKAGMLTLDHKKIEQMRVVKNIDTSFVREYYLFSKLSGERLSYVDEILTSETADSALAVNKDFCPVSYYFDMVLWSTYFSSALSRFFDDLHKVRVWHLFAIAAMLFLAVSYIKRKSQKYKDFATLFALGTTGFSEIVFQILIILTFQVLYGYLYLKLGLIIASFMVGLALGALYVLRRIDSINDPYRYFVGVQFLVLLCPFLLMMIFYAVSRIPNFAQLPFVPNYIFSMLPFFAGFVGGIQFPLANAIYLRQGYDVAASAGTTYSSDLLGSCIGALLVSAFVIPLVGIYGTCIVVTMLNFTALLVLLFAGRR